MDSHSRGNKRPPKGLPLQGESQGRKRKHPLQPNLANGLGRKGVSGKKSKPSGSFLIARAYQEPVGSELIEQVLLQRDYIID